MTKTLLLDCGSGRQGSQRLINELFLEQFDNPILRTLDDAAKLELSGPIAMSTDGYTVTPLFFPGGNIGTLAVHGTVNDVSMLGARPRYLTCGFILEEGLDRFSCARGGKHGGAARSAGVLHRVRRHQGRAARGLRQAVHNHGGRGRNPCGPVAVRQRRAARRRHSGERGRGDHGLAVLGQRATAFRSCKASRATAPRSTRWWNA